MLNFYLRKQSICLLIGLMCAAAVYADSPGYRYVELVYSENNPDEKSLANQGGFTVSGSMPLSSRFYGFGWFNHAEIELCWEECPL